jgi:hypothetical protein
MSENEQNKLESEQIIGSERCEDNQSKVCMLTNKDLDHIFASRIAEVNFTISNRAKELICRAGLQEKWLRARDALIRLQVAPGAFMDTWKVLATNQQVLRTGISTSENVAISQLSFREVFRSMAQLRIQSKSGESVNCTILHDDNVDLVSRIIQRVETTTLPQDVTEKLSEKTKEHALKTTVLVADLEASADTDKLEHLISRSQALKIPLYIIAQDAKSEQTIKGRIYDAHARVCDTPIQVITIPEEMTTPFGFLRNVSILQEAMPDQNDQITPLFKYMFDILREDLKPIQELFSSIRRAYRLQNHEKRVLLTEIMGAVGIPQDDMDKLYQTIERYRDGVAFDLTPITKTVSQTACALEVINPRLARHYARMVIEIAGAEGVDLSEILDEFRDARIQYALINKLGKGVTKDFLKKGMDLVKKYTDIPNPFVDPDKFIDQLFTRPLRDIYFLETMSVVNALLVAGVGSLAGSAGLIEPRSFGELFWNTHTILRKLEVLMIIAKAFPFLGKIPFSWSMEQLENVGAPGSKGIAAFLRNLGQKGWLDAVGVGFLPMTVNHTDKIPAVYKEWIAGGSTILVSLGKPPVYTYGSGNESITYDIFTGPPYYIQLPRQVSIIDDYIYVCGDVGQKSLQWVLAGGAYTTRYIATEFDKIFQLEVEWVGNRKWTWPAHGPYSLKLNKKPPWKVKAKAGLYDLAFALPPLGYVVAPIGVYQYENAPGFETRNQIFDQGPQTMEIERSFLLRVTDYYNALIGASITLALLANIPGLRMLTNSIHDLVSFNGSFEPHIKALNGFVNIPLNPFAEAIGRMTDPQLNSAANQAWHLVGKGLGVAINYLVKGMVRPGPGPDTPPGTTQFQPDATPTFNQNMCAPGVQAGDIQTQKGTPIWQAAYDLGYVGANGQINEHIQCGRLAGTKTLRFIDEAGRITDVPDFYAH